MHERSAGVFAIIAASCLGCNLGRPASSACDAGSECETGTQCLPLLEVDQSGDCIPSAAATCTLSCSTNTDCGGLIDPANGKNDFSCLACGSSGTCAIVVGAVTLLPPTAECQQSSQCAEGLFCLASQMQAAGGTCAASAVDTCTIGCTADSDCAALVDPSTGQTDLTCFNPCPGEGVCGNVE